MQQIRELLPENLWQTMNRKLGQEETLRLLWPALVGPRLALQIHFRQLRSKTLVVGIPDREWRAPMESLESTILESIHRFMGPRRGQSLANSVELVIERASEARPCSPPASSGRGADRRPPQAMQPRCGAKPDGIGLAIEDEDLRDAFLRSAQKYFDRPEAADGKELAQ